jgi:hypothetical protein
MRTHQWHGFLHCLVMNCETRGMPGQSVVNRAYGHHGSSTDIPHLLGWTPQGCTPLLVLTRYTYLCMHATVVSISWRLGWVFYNKNCSMSYMNGYMARLCRMLHRAEECWNLGWINFCCRDHGSIVRLARLTDEALACLHEGRDYKAVLELQTEVGLQVTVTRRSANVLM